MKKIDAKVKSRQCLTGLNGYKLHNFNLTLNHAHDADTLPQLYINTYSGCAVYVLNYVTLLK